jgi:hypothetical protein
MLYFNFRTFAALGAALALAGSGVARADSPPQPVPMPTLTFADLADLADGAPLVIKAQVRKLALLDPLRARSVRAGWARFYVEAKTEALIAGNAPIGEALRYLVDLPLDAKGKPPKLKKQSVVLFARTVPGRPGELQLVATDAQVLWTSALDGQLRGLLAELLSQNAPHKVTGVREAIHVTGNLAGEGETQLFLSTANNEPAAITVQRRPGQAPRWSVSFSEVMGEQASTPRRDTLAWYRLACFLPPLLPTGANVSDDPADRAAAGSDYRFVLTELGSCPRARRR